MTDIPPGLILVHGNQAETLRDLLLAWIARYPLPPLEQETVLVQSNGIAQWLKLSLAADPLPDGGGGCGIAAGLTFLLPARFQWQAYRAVLGEAAVPQTSPFDKTRLAWRLMRLLPSPRGSPVYAPLERFLAVDDDRRKRYQLALRLADLYDQYQVYRADWLSAWQAGEDMMIDARGGRSTLPATQRWQAELWRALLHDARDAGPGRAEIHESFLRSVAEWRGNRPEGLPQRVLVFGISSLPKQTLETLAALSKWLPVLICVNNPCQYYWADIVSGIDLLRAGGGRHARRASPPDETQLHLYAHPLLAAWGKQGRDFIGLLDEFDQTEKRARWQSHLAALGQRIDCFTPRGGHTLLEQLQDDILELRPLHETREHWSALDPARDESIRFHIAHGPQRELEILHDQLLAAFNADPTLRPRDIIVMVPDVETYAPHIRAVFGLQSSNDPRRIPFTLSDRGMRGNDAIAHALEWLLALPQARITAGEAFDLLEVPALRRRFRIADTDLPTLQRWVRDANIRWGLHNEHRQSLGLPAGPSDAVQNSWLFGLRRMLLGFAVGSGGQDWNGIEPYGEIGGLEAALLGPLTDLLDALDELWRTLREPASPPDWCLRLRALLTRFFLAEEADESHTLLRLEEALLTWEEACRDAAFADPLPLSVVAEHWLAALDEGGLTPRFFAGTVTFATLMPMRAIPFRHVCLLGMNDADYPRSHPAPDFDLMARDYRPGDRSRREDDRYLFLEALLSARDRLYLSWAGRNLNDNSPRPPSVLVAQLRDHLAQGWRLEGGGNPVAALTTEHPLQPFSVRYFDGANPALFSYAHEWRERGAAANLPARLSPLMRSEPFSLDELSGFLRRPVDAFFRQRLGVAMRTDDPAAADTEPFTLDALEQWTLQAELVTAQQAALTNEQEVAAARDETIASIRRRGELADGGFGSSLAEMLLEPMPTVFAAYEKQLQRYPVELDALPISWTTTVDETGYALEDRLDSLRTNANGNERIRLVLDARKLIKSASTSRSAAVFRTENLIRHWPAHLAAQLDAPTATVLIGLDGTVRFDALEREQAASLLHTIVEAWHEGMCEPLPLPLKTAAAWVFDRKSAVSTYQGHPRASGEIEDSPYLRTLWPDFSALLADSRFDAWAQRLLLPLKDICREEAA